MQRKSQEQSVGSCRHLLCVPAVGPAGKRGEEGRHQPGHTGDGFRRCSPPATVRRLSSEQIYGRPFLPLAPAKAPETQYQGCNASYILRKIIVNCAALTFPGFLLLDSLAAAIPRARSGNLWGCSAAGANQTAEY